MNASGLENTKQDSRLLYQLCCDAGFSEDMWKMRLFASDRGNTCYSYTYLLSGVNALHSGSECEGVAMEFLGSDIDIMHLIRGTSVIQGHEVSTGESDHMSKMVEASHPAHVYLSLLSPGAHTYDTICTPRFGELVSGVGYFLNGDMLKQHILGVSHGPAVTTILSDETGLDTVLSLHCSDWPSVQKEWLYRKRSFNWPSPNLVRQISQNGCELVSVGNPYSKAKHLEWRISSSSAEQLLIRTFNIYQIQCYFLLKLILTFYKASITRNTVLLSHEDCDASHRRVNKPSYMEKG